MSSPQPSTEHTTHSQQYLDRARRVLAGGVSSHFRRAESIVFSHGNGSRFWDVDGNEYLDYTLSQGPLIHGHSHPAILERVQSSLRRGLVYSGIHPEEVELAEKLTEVIPCAEQLRFSTSGSEADHAALRLARAHTGRPKFIKFEGHYHGWLDTIVASINPPLESAGPEDTPVTVPWSGGLARGALDDVIVLQWNDDDAVERVLGEQGDQIAAIITEPCMCNTGCIEPQPDYLLRLRELCDRHGVLLIFDEVITGFRLALGGAQEHYGVTPDLAVFGKAVAGGFPISILAGRREFMQTLSAPAEGMAGAAVHAGTLNANLMCIAACLACVELLEADNRAAYRALYERTARLTSGLREAAASANLPTLIQGPGPVFHMGFLKNTSDTSGSGVPPVRGTAPGAEEPTSGTGVPPVRGTVPGAEEPTSGTGVPPVTGATSQSQTVLNYRDAVRTYDPALYARFVAAMARRGIRLIGRGIWYTSTVHTDADLDQTLQAARDALREIAQA
jgi:glutamate-1-semialdehyde 2,1-aminomutase